MRVLRPGVRRDDHIGSDTTSVQTMSPRGSDAGMSFQPETIRQVHRAGTYDGGRLVEARVCISDARRGEIHHDARRTPRRERSRVLDNNTALNNNVGDAAARDGGGRHDVLARGDDRPRDDLCRDAAN